MPGVDELLARAEDELRLMCCVSQLSDIPQRVVRLRMLQELSGDDVARELGLRPDHVATLLYRAKKELLRCVTKAGVLSERNIPIQSDQAGLRVRLTEFEQRLGGAIEAVTQAARFVGRFRRGRRTGGEEAARVAIDFRGDTEEIRRDIHPRAGRHRSRARPMRKYSAPMYPAARSPQIDVARTPPAAGAAGSVGVTVVSSAASAFEAASACSRTIRSISSRVLAVTVLAFVRRDHSARRRSAHARSSSASD